MSKDLEIFGDPKIGNSSLGGVTHRFLPQPSDIENLMKEKLQDREIYDEFGRTGEWRLSAKNVLDIIIDLQNGG